MQVEKLSNNLSELVDLLRSEERYPATLTDVASIAEVLIKCMERYFASIDTTMYGEIQHLADHIKQARLEIGRARPNEITANRIPRAGKELDEIVRATEEATNSIMASAESIMSVDSSNDEAKAEIDAACMNIFEACSFQDVTGQRISKVVKTLDFIDERLGSLLGAVDGVADEPPPDAALAGDDAMRSCTVRSFPARASPRTMWIRSNDSTPPERVETRPRTPRRSPRRSRWPPRSRPMLCPRSPPPRPHRLPPRHGSSRPPTPAPPRATCVASLGRRGEGAMPVARRRSPAPERRAGRRQSRRTAANCRCAGQVKRFRQKLPGRDRRTVRLRPARPPASPSGARGRTWGRSVPRGSCPRVASGFRQALAHRRARVRRAPMRR